MQKWPDVVVDPAWLEAHREDPKVRLIEVDFDGTDAYDAGHIPGARGWYWKDALWDPLSREFPSPEEFARRLGAAGIADDTTVVFYGEPHQFGTYGWWAFRYCGHRDARVLDGGRTRWVSEGRPLTTAVPNFAPVSYTPRPRNEGMRAPRDAVLAALRGSGTIILDNRSPEEYRGERVNILGRPDHGAERHGRIPGARHLHSSDLLQADGRFKPELELRALAEARGATADKDIILYCRLSHRATLVYFVLTQLLGYPRVRSYDGSWTEWGSMVGMPIER
jgi:thiosulfate/3-mercaptopyruvate sulfurtransferase